ncbi:2-phospho-L-lactate guanylyltransferase [Nocardia paucivorans]|uniref:2-phospho-L-lactate guanylyltransferase n=1 Tax=Nocardia paucivorans TaxID=114259 RepID=UPI0003161576|nr:2-phospho-L-lactate guanylyltransferase [Nocardia paucivorans]
MRQHTVHTVYAVIAVKSLDRAKSRLAGALPPPDRARLVLAMFSDTLRAACAVSAIGSVTVVTPDPAVAELARARGAEVHPEPTDRSPVSGESDRLNTALAAAADTLRRWHGPIDLLALQADLPALRADELADMLATAPAARSLVVDHTGTGTAALLARAGTPLNPRFGPESAARHSADGAIELDGDWPGLRLDVDTVADLDKAVALGAGPDTRTLLRTLGHRVPALGGGFASPGTGPEPAESITTVC